MIIRGCRQGQLRWCQVRQQGKGRRLEYSIGVEVTCTCWAVTGDR